MLLRSFTVLLASLTLNSAFAASNVTGMVCDGNGGRSKIVVDIRVKGANARISLRGAQSLSSDLNLDVSAAAVAPILENKLETMHKQTIKSEGTELFFRKDGTDFDGQIRLAIEIRSSEGSERLENCGLTFKSNMKATEF